MENALTEKKLRLPSMDAAEQYLMSDEEHEKISSQLLVDGGKPCDWCGETDWSLSKEFYTDTTFDILPDRHRHTRVWLSVIISCEKCGNKKYFDTDRFGITTKGGVDC